MQIINRQDIYFATIAFHTRGFLMSSQEGLIKNDTFSDPIFYSAKSLIF